MKSVGEQSVEQAPIWSIPETARYLRVSVDIVNRLIRDGKLPYQRLGNRNIVLATAVKNYLQNGWQYKTPVAAEAQK